ncbi:MAG: hypothetical protein EPN79_10935 [Burkholderiaceae bacterium]|nr:MAG: hypothetical protein EPN79_10935 [Burkholderiaceae bacterium]TBR76802.1 MAG: hypothetical protein EPN64_06140 [Burkholderiaceae bacterium]
MDNDINSQVILPPAPRRLGRAQGATYLRTYLLADEEPKSINFRDTLVHIDGLPDAPNPKDLLWGVYGSRAINDASIYMSRASIDENKRLYEIDMWLRIDHLKSAAAAVDEAIVRETGLVVTSRLRAVFRDEFKQTLLSYLEPYLSKKMFSTVSEFDLDTLLVQFPNAAWKYIREREWVFAVVHPAIVQVAKATEARAAVMARMQVITFRADASRVVEATVRQDARIPIIF